GASSEISTDAARHAAGNAERIDDLLRIETKGGTDTRRCTHRTEHRGRVETGLVHSLRHDEAQPAKDFDTDGNSRSCHMAIGIVPLTSCEHCRDDHRAGMLRAAFKSVGKVLAMRGSAVDESRAGGVQGA